MNTLTHQVSVRAARAQFSRLLKSAEQGTDIVILDHGRPRARLTSLLAPRKPFQVDREWLARMPMHGPRLSAEQIVREERDRRD